MVAYSDTIECVVNWDGGPGQGFAKNILHLFNVANDVDQALADAVADALDDAFSTTDWRAAIATSVQLHSILLKDQRADDGVTFESAINHSGGETGQVLPAQVALVTTLRTAVGSRRGRGRIYGWGYTEPSNTGTGTCDPATAAGTLAGWTKFQANLLDIGGGSEIDLGVLSKLDAVTRPVTGLFTDTQWDDQRRRRS